MSRDEGPAADTYDRELDDIFAVQDDIAQSWTASVAIS
jgi:TolB-like protein